MNQSYNRISLMSVLKERLGLNMVNGFWKFSKVEHNKCLELIPHTSYCIIHRFNEYFQGKYQFQELNKCQGRFGCDFINDFNVNRISFDEYNYKLLNIPCYYENSNYYHQANNYELHLIDQEHSLDQKNSIFEMISENILTIEDEMKYKLNQSVIP